MNGTRAALAEAGAAEESSRTQRELRPAQRLGQTVGNRVVLRAILGHWAMDGRWVLVGIGALALAGCDPGSSSPISGSFRWHHVSVGVEQDRDPDPVSWPEIRYFADGMFWLGVGDDSGGFRVDDLPPDGPCGALDIGNFGVYCPPRGVEMEITTSGQRREFSRHGSTLVSVSGLEPWTANDRLTAWSLDVWGDLRCCGSPATGGTTFQGTELTGVLAQEADKVVLSQVRADDAGNETVVSYGVAAVSLEPSGRDETLSFTASLERGEASTVAFSASDPDTFVRIRKQGGTGRAVEGAPVVATWIVPSGSADETRSYLDPFPEAETVVEVGTGDPSRPRSLRVEAETGGLHEAADLGPVTDLRVNGVDAMAGGVLPYAPIRLEWSPVPGADQYEVGGPGRGGYITHETSVELQPLWGTGDTAIEFVVTARRCPTCADVKRPFKHAFPIDESRVYSVAFTPTLPN